MPNSIHFSSEKTQYIAPSWPDLENLTFQVAQQMRQAGEKFDRIVTLAKGGWPMTRSLVDFLQIDQVASIGVRFYTGHGEHLATPTIYQDLPITVEGERVLLFDDVADTGDSLKFVSEYLQERGVKSIKTATIFYKPHSKIKPDFFGTKTKAWIIFPYDAVDTILQLTPRWLAAGLESTEINRRLRQLNISQAVIDAYPLSELGS